MNRISELKILQGVPFEKDSNTILTFSSANEQKEFFEDYAIESFEDLSFVKGFLYRKVRLETDIENVYKANYLMWKNNDGKWFYAYITGFEFISEYAVEISFDMDYFQSYMGDIVFAESNIEREHTRGDYLGEFSFYIHEDDILPIRHTTGGMDNFSVSSWKVCIMYRPNLLLESIANTSTTYTSPSGSQSGTIGSNDGNLKYKDLQEGTAVGTYDKLFSGVSVLTMNISNATEIKAVKDKLSWLTATGYNIINVFMIPKDWDITTNPFMRMTTKRLNNSINPYYTDRKLNGYEPVNNKCFFYPFCYLKATTRQGTIKNFKYERFYLHDYTNKNNKNKNEEKNNKNRNLNATNIVEFKLFETIYGDYKMTLTPQAYEVYYNDSEEGLYPADIYKWTFDKSVSTEKGTSCIWNEDMFFKNIIGNASKIIIGAGMIASGIGAEVGAGLIASGGAGAVGSAGAGGTSPKATQMMLDKGFKQGLGGVSKVAEAVLDNAFEGDNSGVNITDNILLMANNLLGISLICMLPEYEDIAIIDEYFSKYGYRYNNSLVRPNVLGRSRFNYVRTNQARIRGNIPIECRDYVMTKLNMGITFWHDKTNFDYGDFRSTGYVNSIIDKDLTARGTIF